MINKIILAYGLLFAATLNSAATKTVFLVTRTKLPLSTTYTKYSNIRNYSAAFHVKDTNTYGGYNVLCTQHGKMHEIIDPVMAKKRYQLLGFLWKQQRKTSK